MAFSLLHVTAVRTLESFREDLTPLPIHVSPRSGGPSLGRLQRILEEYSAQ